MKQHKYPSLYQINTRVWLTDLSEDQGRPATLDDIPDTELDRLAAQHEIEWIWVKGHAGHAENERADQLARRGVEQARMDK